MLKNICKYVCMFMLAICLMGEMVSAQENDIYYNNSNGVKMSKEEYDFIGEFYYDGYQEYISLNSFQTMKDMNIFSKPITKVSAEDNGIQLLTDVTYQSASKKLVMKYSCTSICMVSFLAEWLNVANVRSYDLIGAYSPSSNALSYVDSRMTYSGKTVYATEDNISKNGISATFKLPTTDGKYRFVFDFTAPVGTKVYASYQHAKKSISLANSRKYTFASSGYGGVFRFDSSVSSYYDAMGGVSATLK